MSSAMQRGGRGRGRLPPNGSSDRARGHFGRVRQAGSSGRSGRASTRGQGAIQRQNGQQPGTIATQAPRVSKASGLISTSAGTPSIGSSGSWSLQSRWQALTKSHEQERANAIAKGLVADPDRPKRLSEAVTLVGICQDMCPEYERVERIMQKDVWRAEYDPAQLPQKVAAEHRMVKKFRRAAAGLGEQLPSDLRPPAVLQNTIRYLFKDLINEATALENIHHFIWDRTRAVRNDFSIQQLTKISDIRVAVDCYERVARFHILSLHQLAQFERPYDQYDAYQEREQLDRTFLSLMQYYDDNRQQFSSPNEAEFRAYYIIFQILNPVPDLEDRVQTWPLEIGHDQRVRTALKLYAAAANVTDAHGPLRPRQPHLVAQSNWARFWSLVRSNETSYTMACVAEIYFTLIQKMALNEIWLAYRQGANSKSEDWSLDELVEVLGFDEIDEVQNFCQQHGFKIIEREDGTSYLDLTSVRGKQFPDSAVLTSHQSFSHELVECKRYGRTLSAIINGLSVGEAQQAGLIEEIEDTSEIEEAESDSLFVPPSNTIGSDSRVTLRDSQDREEATDKNGQVPIEGFKSSEMSSGPVATTQVPFSFQQSPKDNNGDTEPSTASTDPFSVGKPSSFALGSTTTNANPFNFGKPSQPPTNGFPMPPTTSGFGKPSAPLSGSILTGSDNSAVSLSFNQAKQAGIPAKDHLTTQTPPPLKSPFAINNLPPSNAENTKVAEASSPTTSTPNPFAFPPAKTTEVTTQFSSPFSQIATPVPSGQSSVFANPFVPTTTTASKETVQGSANPFTFPTPSTPSSSNPTIAKETTSPFSFGISIPVAPLQDQQQPRSFSAVSTGVSENPKENPKENPQFSFSANQATQHPSQQSLPAFSGFPSSQSNPVQDRVETSKADSLSSKSTSDRYEFPANANVEKQASTGIDQPARPAMTNAPNGSTLLSAGSIKVSPAFQNKHQPSRPSPLSHVTTFTSDSSVPSQSPSGIITASELKSFENGSQPPKTNVQRPSTAALKADTRINVLDAFSSQVLLDESAGLMKQFIEFISHDEIQGALEQFELEEIERKAQETRNRWLTRKYGRLWREKYWKRKMANKGRERRRRRANALAVREEAKKKTDFKNERKTSQEKVQEITAARRSKLQEPVRQRKHRLDGSESDAVGGASKKQKENISPPKAEASIDAANKSFGESVMFEHIRDPASFIQPQRIRAQTLPNGPEKPSTPTEQAGMRNLSPRPSFIGSSLSPSRRSGTRASYGERVDQTQTSYFMLRALGINPHVNQNRKRARESSVTSLTAGADPDDVGDETHASLPERKRIQTDIGARFRARSPVSTTPATVPRPRPRPWTTNSNDYSPAASREYRAATDASDEALFARIRRVREACAHTTPLASRRTSRPASRSSQISPPGESRPKSEGQRPEDDSDFFTQSRYLRQVMAESIDFFREERQKEEERQSRQSRASSRGSTRELDGSFGSSGSGTLGQSSGQSQDVLKYRTRESKFVPREMYGKWNGPGSLKRMQMGGTGEEYNRDEEDVQKSMRIRAGKSKGKEKVVVNNEDGQDNWSYTGLDDSFGAEDSDSENGEEYEDGDNEIDEGDFEDDEEYDEDQEYDDGDEEEMHGVPNKVGFIPSTSRFGVSKGVASDAAFGPPLPAFDPKGKSGTTAEDAFELSD